MANYDNTTNSNIKKQRIEGPIDANVTNDYWNHSKLNTPTDCIDFLKLMTQRPQASSGVRGLMNTIKRDHVLDGWARSHLSKLIMSPKERITTAQKLARRLTRPFMTSCDEETTSETKLLQVLFGSSIDLLQWNKNCQNRISNVIDQEITKLVGELETSYALQPSSSSTSSLSSSTSASLARIRQFPLRNALLFEATTHVSIHTPLSLYAMNKSCPTSLQEFTGSLDPLPKQPRFGFKKRHIPLVILQNIFSFLTLSEMYDGLAMTGSSWRYYIRQNVGRLVYTIDRVNFDSQGWFISDTPSIITSQLATTPSIITSHLQKETTTKTTMSNPIARRKDSLQYHHAIPSLSITTVPNVQILMTACLSPGVWKTVFAHIYFPRLRFLEQTLSVTVSPSISYTNPCMNPVIAWTNQWPITSSKSNPHVLDCQLIQDNPSDHMDHKSARGDDHRSLFLSTFRSCTRDQCLSKWTIVCEGNACCHDSPGSVSWFDGDNVTNSPLLSRIFANTRSCSTYVAWCVNITDLSMLGPLISLWLSIKCIDEIRRSPGLKAIVVMFVIRNPEQWIRAKKVWKEFEGEYADSVAYYYDPVFNWMGAQHNFRVELHCETPIICRHRFSTAQTAASEDAYFWTTRESQEFLHKYEREFETDVALHAQTGLNASYEMQIIEPSPVSLSQTSNILPTSRMRGKGVAPVGTPPPVPDSIQWHKIVTDAKKSARAEVLSGSPTEPLSHRRPRRTASLGSVNYRDYDDDDNDHNDDNDNTSNHGDDHDDSDNSNNNNYKLAEF